MKSFKMKGLTIAFVLAFLFSTSMFSFALPSQASEPAKENAQVPVKVTIVSDSLVKVQFIHYEKPAKPAKPGDSLSRAFKLTGWHIDTPMSYTLNDSGSGLSYSECENAIVPALHEWNNNLEAGLPKVFIEYLTTDNNVYSPEDINGTNLISFENLDTGTLAIATTWYSRSARTVVESDIAFNTDYIWGVDESTSVYDLQNIATHELGHTCGLSDLYSISYDQQTMYGYGGLGETIKRDLASGDIAGLHKIY